MMRFLAGNNIGDGRRRRFCPMVLLLLVLLLCLSSSSSSATVENNEAVEATTTTKSLRRTTGDAVDDSMVSSTAAAAAGTTNDKGKDQETATITTSVEREEEGEEEVNNPKHFLRAGSRNALEEGEEEEEEENKKTTTTDGDAEPEEQQSILPDLLTSAKNFTNIKINTTAITLTACEQIEMTLAFITSLDFDSEFWKVIHFTKTTASLGGGGGSSKGESTTTATKDEAEEGKGKEQKKKEKEEESDTTTTTTTDEEEKERRSLKEEESEFTVGASESPYIPGTLSTPIFTIKKWEVYIGQIIMFPISFIMALWGSNLLHPTCCLAAAGIGIFFIFHLVDYINTKSIHSTSLLLQTIVGQIDCQMKLALSLISASISAMLASTFLRFGLFSLGALSAGGISYLIFDAFPFLDPTRPPDQIMDGGATATATATLHGQMDSELSPFGWIITTLVGVMGGLFLRWYEQASLEIVTAAMGGLGCSYSIHTFVILQGGHLNRSLVFLIANFIAFSGWRFQRHRRLYKSEYAHKKNDQEQQQQREVVPLIQQQPPLQPPPTYAYATTVTTAPPPPLVPSPPQSAQSWNQLQSSINNLLQRSSTTQQQQQQQQQSQGGGGGSAAPSEEQIIELTKSLNTLVARMETNKRSGDISESNSAGGGEDGGKRN